MSKDVSKDMSKEKVYAKFEIEKGKREFREKDVKDEETGEWYRVRELSALKRMKISDASIDYSGDEPKFNTEKTQLLTLKYGVIEPDFSQRSIEEIGEWLDTKSPILFTKLLREITPMKGFDMKSLQNLRGEELTKNPLPQPSSS